MFDGVVSPLANISTVVTDVGIAIEAFIFWLVPIGQWLDSCCEDSMAILRLVKGLDL